MSSVPQHEANLNVEASALAQRQDAIREAAGSLALAPSLQEETTELSTELLQPEPRELDLGSNVLADYSPTPKPKTSRAKREKSPNDIGGFQKRYLRKIFGDIDALNLSIDDAPVLVETVFELKPATYERSSTRDKQRSRLLAYLSGKNFDVVGQEEGLTGEAIRIGLINIVQTIVTSSSYKTESARLLLDSKLVEAHLREKFIRGDYSWSRQSATPEKERELTAKEKVYGNHITVETEELQETVKTLVARIKLNKAELVALESMLSINKLKDTDETMQAVADKLNTYVKKKFETLQNPLLDLDSFESAIIRKVFGTDYVRGNRVEKVPAKQFSEAFKYDAHTRTPNGNSPHRNIVNGLLKIARTKPPVQPKTANQK